ncbi:response regulator transcription factor [Bacillus wudalianchiensis]|uniref:response regulator transcription factor n=1 Tax=Pseudobacillus wudalianchiensis TaxID=1743143 RepID=UPI000980CB53
MCLEIISRYLAQRLHEHWLLKNVKNSFFVNSLTPRESEVLCYVKKGYSNKQIADILFISANTVKKHIQSLYEKFDVNNRTSLCFKVHNVESLNNTRS